MHCLLSTCHFLLILIPFEEPPHLTRINVTTVECSEKKDDNVTTYKFDLISPQWKNTSSPDGIASGCAPVGAHALPERFDIICSLR